MVESVRNLDIPWFIGVMCVVQTLAQVCPYSDPGCTCDIDTLICSNLQQIPPLNTGVNVSRITQLSFKKGNIITISKNSLPPGLETIELLNNPFSDISDDAFDASAATLQTIYIGETKFNNLPTALKKLTALTALFIFDTVIHDWDAPTLKQIASTLMYFDLREIGLSSWPSWISDFHLLRNLDVSFNNFKYIPHDAFISVKDSLTTLDLSSTGLTQIPHALSLLSILDTLSLSYNNIAHVSEIEKITKFPFAQKLNYLILDSVGLTSMANFSNLTSLRSLGLANNRIPDVPVGSLPTSLTGLFLKGNRISFVPPDVASLSHLYELDVSGNLITRIEPKCLPSSLTNLYLSFNKITIISNSALINLNLLRTLDLGDTPVLTISPSAFADLASLQYLNLTNSHLTEIPLAFAQLNPQTDISLTTTQPLSCPCPAPRELVQWFSSLTFNSLKPVICSNGQSVTSYLSGQCGPPTATASHEAITDSFVINQRIPDTDIYESVPFL